MNDGPKVAHGEGNAAPFGRAGYMDTPRSVPPRPLSWPFVIISIESDDMIHWHGQPTTPERHASYLKFSTHRTDYAGRSGVILEVLHRQDRICSSNKAREPSISSAS